MARVKPIELLIEEIRQVKERNTRFIWFCG